MLKKIFLLVGAPIVVIFGGFGMFIIFDRAPMIPSKPDCGLTLLGTLDQQVPDNVKKQSWKVYNGPLADTNVKIKELSSSKIDAPAGMGGGCRLVFEKISNPSLRGTDWRVGRDFPIELFRGKTIKTTFMLKAKSKAVLPAGTAYSYDGNRVKGVAAANIDTEWQTFEIAQQIGEEATTFEIWFRMIFDTPQAIPNSNSIDMLASIEEVESAHTNHPKRRIDHMTQQELEMLIAELEQELILMKAQLTSKVKQAQKATAKWTEHIENALCHSTLLIANGSTIQQSDTSDEWKIYRYDASSPAPTVDVVKSETGCSLAVTDAPVTPRNSIDWRMGKQLDVAAIRGKLLTFSAMIGANQPVSFSSGSLYVYDGENFASTKLRRLSQTKSPYEVKLRISNDAQILQTWIRLVLGDGIIKPEEAILYFDPVIRIAD